MAGGARALPRSWNARGLVAGVLAASWLWWGWRLVEAGFVALNRPVSAASSAPHAAPRVFHARSALAPHKVGECHRLCPVSYGDFVCLLAGGRDEGFDNACLFPTSCVIWGGVGARRGCRVLFRGFLCQFGVKVFVPLPVSAASLHQHDRGDNRCDCRQSQPTPH